MVLNYKRVGDITVDVVMWKTCTYWPEIEFKLQIFIMEYSLEMVFKSEF